MVPLWFSSTHADFYSSGLCDESHMLMPTWVNHGDIAGFSNVFQWLGTSPNWSNSFLFPGEIWWNPHVSWWKPWLKPPFFTTFHGEIPTKSAGAASAASGGGRSLETVSWHQHPKKTGEKWWFQHVSTMVFHGEMMVLTMVLTRKWWFHGDWQFNHEQNAGFMGISWGKWSIWWSWPWRKDGDITILAMQGWWLVISWGFKQRWYRGKLMEYLTEYYQPYGVFFIVVSWWFHRESTHFYG